MKENIQFRAWLKKVPAIAEIPSFGEQEPAAVFESEAEMLAFAQHFGRAGEFRPFGVKRRRGVAEAERAE